MATYAAEKARRQAQARMQATLEAVNRYCGDCREQRQADFWLDFYKDTMGETSTDPREAVRSGKGCSLDFAICWQRKAREQADAHGWAPEPDPDHRTLTEGQARAALKAVERLLGLEATGADRELLESLRDAQEGLQRYLPTAPEPEGVTPGDWVLDAVPDRHDLEAASFYLVGPEQPRSLVVAMVPADPCGPAEAACLANARLVAAAKALRAAADEAWVVLREDCAEPNPHPRTPSALRAISAAIELADKGAS